MNRLLLASILVLLPAVTFGQQVVSTTTEGTVVASPEDAASTTEQIQLLQRRKSLLEQRLASLTPASPDYSLVADWSNELGRSIDQLKSSLVTSSPTSAVMAHSTV